VWRNPLRQNMLKVSELRSNGFENDKNNFGRDSRHLSIGCG